MPGHTKPNSRLRETLILAITQSDHDVGHLNCYKFIDSG